MTAKDNEGNKGEVTNIMSDNCRIYKRVCKVRSLVFVSSARWVMSVAGMVESKMCAAGRSLRAAGVGRVVEYSWTIVAGS